MINRFAIATGGVQSSTNILQMLVATRGFTPESSTGADYMYQGQYIIPPPASINGIVCHVTSFNRVLTYVQSKNKIPGSDFNPIAGIGWDSMTMTITGEESTMEDRDNILLEFSRQQDNQFIFQPGWFYKFRLEEITPTEEIGFITSYPWAVRGISETPYKYATGLNSFYILIDSNPQTIIEDTDGRLIVSASNAGAMLDIVLTAGESSDVFYEVVDVW